MIWIRRFLIVPLGLVFFVLFVLSLIIFRVNGTFLEPDFYKDQLAKADIYNFILIDLPTSGIEELRSKTPDFFYDILGEDPLDTTGLTTDDIVSSFGRALPPTWVQEQVEQVIDQAGGYITGERDTFEINVQPAERADVALEEMKTLLKKGNFFELLFDEVVDLMLEGNLSQFTQLPFGVNITQEEISAALRELVPPSWLEEQALGVIDEAGPYLVGRTDSLQVVIPLGDRREIALAIIEDLAESKLTALVEVLPECDTGQLPFSGGFPSLNELPQCMPSGIQVESLIDLLNIDITGGVGEMIGSQIPDDVVYTEADLRQALTGDDGSSNLDVLDNLREVISQGWTYTDVDLREDLADDGDGAAGANDGTALDALDDYRSQLNRARNLRFLVYILTAVLLALIGVLGGRNWQSKVAWASATLGISAVIVFAASGPVYNSIGQNQIDELRVDIVEDIDSSTTLLAAEKGMDVVQTVADDFLAGIGRSSLMLFVVAGMVFVAALARPKLVRRTSPAEEAETT